MINTLSALLALSLLGIPAAVQAQFIWQTNSDGVSLVITGYTGPGGDVIIPSQINGLTVTDVAGNGFYQCTNLTSITIPGTVTTISSFGEAFAGCGNLKSAVMLPGVADIGPSSFEGCISLTNVAIPNSVTNIDATAFNGCASLANVTFPAGLISIGDAAFADCENLGNVNLPDGLTVIEPEAFEDCGVSTLTIPGSVAYIGTDAFSECRNLTSVTIANGVTGIEWSMFWLCSALTNITIPGSVTNIANNAFAMCSSLQSVTLPAGLTDIGMYAFNQCTRLTNVTIPNGVTTIGTGAFANCTNLTSLVIPSSVTNYGGVPLAGDSSLSNLFFQGNAPDISENNLLYSEGGDLVVYYLPGTTGWSNFASAGSYPVVLWNPQIQIGDGNFGVKNNEFGFGIAGATNIPVMVEACASLSNANWVSLQSLTLTNGLAYFSDSQWAHYPYRFYRIVPP